ncbi:MAG: NADH-dependent [FeFe] hydrogenase, group A6 [Terracidiphilus sp.]|jgi:NADH-quinone oxidoreductase subunit G
MNKVTQPVLTIDGRTVAIEGERNLLELVRKANIDLPTFCYHSELSVYGACRLCLVQVEGRGIMGACSTPPEPGLKIQTTTPEIREIRRIAVELLLANHDQSCPTCSRSANCQLQSLAQRLGVKKVRFKSVYKAVPLDESSPSLVRDPNKCVLCGDCVRMCSEIQGIGAIDFAHRGHDVSVQPAFGKQLGDVECVNCGQCASVCPTGALTVKSEVDQVWNLLADATKTVIVQIAPAVRVGLGECFGLMPGEITTGRIVAALKHLGFNQIYDTSFAADLTVIEEGSEFLQRKTHGGTLPMFTSCCPGWVKYAEQYFPELLPNLSTCRSPQAMFGSLVKAMLPEQLNIERKNLKVVSIMPCTAKKFEAQRPEMGVDGDPDVDHVLTTQELARMIQSAGLIFDTLQPESFDMPFGFYTGAGVIFGNSGGVTEAVLRYAAEKVTGKKLEQVEFQQLRGDSGLREATVVVNGAELKLAVVHGLRNARVVAEQVRAGKSHYDLIEVMACPGGCVGGAGQPVTTSRDARALRTKGLYNADKMLQLHKSQDNVFITECYAKFLGDIGGERAHHLLHTTYQSRHRIADESLPLMQSPGEDKLKVSVCLGTNCFLKGSQEVLNGVLRHAEQNGLENRLDVRAGFCFEKCECGPTVMVGGEHIPCCTAEKAIEAVSIKLDNDSAEPACGADKMRNGSD